MNRVRMQDVHVNACIIIDIRRSELRPGATSSFLLLVVMPLLRVATPLLLVANLVTSSKARSYTLPLSYETANPPQLLATFDSWRHHDVVLLEEPQVSESELGLNFV